LTNPQRQQGHPLLSLRAGHSVEIDTDSSSSNGLSLCASTIPCRARMEAQDAFDRFNPSTIVNFEQVDNL
jgi:hypothetical protein